MNWILALPSAVYICAFIFVIYAVSQSSRPKKAMRRTFEFVFYTGFIMTLTAFGIAGAGPREELLNAPLLVLALSLLKTLVSSLALVRLGVIMLKLYGQVEALRKYVAAQTPEEE